MLVRGSSPSNWPLIRLFTRTGYCGDHVPSFLQRLSSCSWLKLSRLFNTFTANSVKSVLKMASLKVFFIGFILFVRLKYHHCISVISFLLNSSCTVYYLLLQLNKCSVRWYNRHIVLEKDGNFKEIYLLNKLQC